MSPTTPDDQTSLLFQCRWKSPKDWLNMLLRLMFSAHSDRTDTTSNLRVLLEKKAPFHRAEHMRRLVRVTLNEKQNRALCVRHVFVVKASESDLRHIITVSNGLQLCMAVPDVQSISHSSSFKTPSTFCVEKRLAKNYMIHSRFLAMSLARPSTIFSTSSPQTSLGRRPSRPPCP